MTLEEHFNAWREKRAKYLTHIKCLEGKIRHLRYLYSKALERADHLQARATLARDLQNNLDALSHEIEQERELSRHLAESIDEISPELEEYAYNRWGDCADHVLYSIGVGCEPFDGGRS